MMCGVPASRVNHAAEVEGNAGACGLGCAEPESSGRGKERRRIPCTAAAEAVAEDLWLRGFCISHALWVMFFEVLHL